MTLSAPRFFCQIPLAAGAEIALPETAARHAVRALRLKSGAAITLFNGEGGEYQGTIASIEKDAVRVALAAYSPAERESALDVTLVQALGTSDKMDWIVQKAVELGVTRVQPMLARRCVLRLDGDRAETRVAHWQAVAIAACEQSGRNRVPQVLPLRSLVEATALAHAALKVALSPDEGVALNSIEAAQRPVALFVGPEGGFSVEEQDAMRRAECRFVSLGPRVLRTETAGVAALAAMQALWGDWRFISSP
jgi:16S rRNA (uracil1498-N3)-methyltransferase